MTLDSPRRLGRCLTLLAAISILIFGGGCATKRFVPRILSEAVTVRDAAGRPTSRETASVTPRAARARSNSTSAARKAGVARSSAPQTAAVGTMGDGQSAPVVVPESSAPLAQAAPAAAPAPSPAAGAPLVARVASMADGGLVVLAALATVFVSGLLYRRRV